MQDKPSACPNDVGHQTDSTRHPGEARAWVLAERAGSRRIVLAAPVITSFFSGRLTCCPFFRTRRSRAVDAWRRDLWLIADARNDPPMTRAFASVWALVDFLARRLERRRGASTTPPRSQRAAGDITEPGPVVRARLGGSGDRPGHLGISRMRTFASEADGLFTQGAHPAPCDHPSAQRNDHACSGSDWIVDRGP